MNIRIAHQTISLNLYPVIKCEVDVEGTCYEVTECKIFSTPEERNIFLQKNPNGPYYWWQKIDEK